MEGASAIRILVPETVTVEEEFEREDGTVEIEEVERCVGFYAALVFRVEDTEGENLVEIGALVGKVNEEIASWQGGLDNGMEPDDVNASDVWGSIEAWCEEHSYEMPRKIGIAQRLVESAISGDTQIVSKENEDILTHIHEWALDHFDTLTQG